jgi:hypothetical protein
VTTQVTPIDGNNHPLAFVDSSWAEAPTAVDNNTVTATKAAAGAGHSHRVTSISGSFSGAAAGKLMTLTEDPAGTPVVKWRGYVTNQFAIAFVQPIKILAGKAVALAMAASGAGGTLGAVTMTGFTEPS